MLMTEYRRGAEGKRSVDKRVKGCLERKYKQKVRSINILIDATMLAD